mgnify:CR=1 FL=1
MSVAEAAKVIENTQRDLNIALVNELSVLFERLNIDTIEVLEAAGTKWNFLPFRPGLVGGHRLDAGGRQDRAAAGAHRLQQGQQRRRRIVDEELVKIQRSVDVVLGW